MARLFFALWPDEAAALSLERLAAEMAIRARGKPVARSKIHLTLAFLGEVDAGRIAVEPEAIAAPAFDLVLDCVGSFAGARVAWAGFVEPPPALANLQSRLASELRGQGLRLEDRPFAPHLTLVRHIGAAQTREAIDPIDWRVREVVLVKSQAGRYSAVNAWPLPA
jgi:RNA 2',3'-cyclic 3'-phosphodiesterase